MKKIILKWVWPQFIYVTHVGYVLAILGEDAGAQDWLYSHYSNLYCTKNGIHTNPEEYFETNMLGITAGNVFGGVPLLTYEITRKNLLNIPAGTLFDYFYESLRQEKYIYTNINFNGIVTDFDYIHNILIHGIDFEEKKIHLLGYMNSVFCSYSVDFKLFSESFYSPFSVNLSTDIILLSKNNRKYPFNISVLSTQLQDYLESKISIERFEYYLCKDKPVTDLNEETQYAELHNYFAGNTRTFGLEAQNVLTEYIDYFISVNDPNKYFDLRSYRCFMEYRQLMYKRWLYLTEKGCLTIDKHLLNNFSIYAQKAAILFYALAKMQLRSAFDNNKLIKCRNDIKELICAESIDLKHIADTLSTQG
jgi:hypothetical protein